jgi:hypothetical protein
MIGQKEADDPRRHTPQASLREWSGLGWGSSLNAWNSRSL